MTSANSPVPKQNPSKSASSKKNALATDSTETEKPFEIRWRVIVPIALVGAIVLLTGLPLGSVFIVNSLGCCFTDGPENLVTFWAALTAGFLALFGMLVTSVFIITAFRVDATAQLKADKAARHAADEAVNTYLERYKAKLFEEIEEVKVSVEKAAEEAKKAISKAHQEIETQRDAAAGAITNAQEAVTKAAGESQQAMDSVREGVEKQSIEATRAITKAEQTVETQRGKASRAISSAQEAVAETAKEAQQATGAAHEGAKGQRDEAIRAIGRMRAEVENAARNARERIDQATQSLSPPEDESKSPDA